MHRGGKLKAINIPLRLKLYPRRKGRDHERGGGRERAGKEEGQSGKRYGSKKRRTDGRTDGRVGRRRHINFTKFMICFRKNS